MPIESADDAAFDRVCSAVALISSVDPRRFEKLRKLLRGVLIVGTAGNVGQYHHNLRLCLVDDRWAHTEDATVARIAAVLVHETTHARLQTCGFGYEPADRERVEAVCLRSELAFAARLTGTDASSVRERAFHNLRRDPYVWTDAAATERALVHFEAIGTPRWLLTLLRRLYAHRLTRG